MKLTDYQRSIGEMLREWRAPIAGLVLEESRRESEALEWEVIWTALVFAIAGRLKIEPRIMFVEYCRGDAERLLTDKNLEILLPDRFQGDVDMLITALEMDGVLHD